VNALCHEIDFIVSAGAELSAHTVYFGGGTPSLLEADQILQILSHLNSRFRIEESAEINLEANPGTLNKSFLEAIYQIGINRLSIGMQSYHPDDLKVLGRIHQFGDVIEACGWARGVGFRNINLDLIYGIPGQSNQRWLDTLRYAVNLHPEHLSMYSLTIEEGTQLYNWWRKGLVSEISDDEMADRYISAQELLIQEGYSPYEISNWAQRRENGSLYICHHNLQYWRNLPYLGIGAGAHSFYKGYRYFNVKGIREYISKIESASKLDKMVSPAVEGFTAVDRWTEMEETMMVGLRLVEEGISPERFYDRFGVTVFNAFGRQIEKLIKKGLLEIISSADGKIRLTQHGRLLGNQVFLEFIGNKPPAGVINR
jgi:oxygen-independent coproporphyrinogen-3 oxidase